MKLISWNVNGVRAVLAKGLLDFVKSEKPDALCLQEVKAEPHHFPGGIPGYSTYWNSAEKKGYSGTATFLKEKPLSVIYGLGIPKHDREGRVITAELSDFYLINVYTPNSKRDLSRLAYRTKEWDTDFLAFAKKLEKKKPVIFCGDLNVAHKEIDLTNPASNRKSHGFTDEERAGFDKMMASGFLDTFRLFNKEGGHYTWWSQFNQCRKRNIGWRIDYFCASSSLKNRIVSAGILPEVMGSDHCPVVLVLKSGKEKKIIRKKTVKSV